MQKPTFFISSTIFDFIDLRSAIKWWLEENNYTVNASEFNDFGKPLDENSYEACLKAINNSDYFILLIGDRIGGMYDDEITITQMEYRYAYERMLSGKIKIINFIRQDTWTTFLSDTKKINDIEADGTIDKSVISKIFNPKDKIRFKFINEVRRVEEMKEGERPIGNWLHRFSTFSDITSVFRIELGGKVDLNFKQNRFIILNDIKRNLIPICSKIENEIYPIAVMSSKLWEDFKFDPDSLKIKLSNERWINYAAFYVSCLQIRAFRTSRIETFYKAGFFLEYDKEINDFTSGDINQMASNLLSYYDKLNGLHKSMYEGDNNKLIKLGKKADNSHLIVTPIEVFFALDFHDTLWNCIDTSTSLYRALKGLKYSIPKQIQHERLPGNMRRKEGEYITEADIDKFLNA